MEVGIIRPFGPSIAKVKIPKKILNDLNQYVDQVNLDFEKKQKTDIGNTLVGDVTQEISIDPKTAEKIGWLQFLVDCTHEWIRLSIGQKIKSFKLKQSWIVRQFKNEYNPVHWHSGHISGAGFLKLPDNFGKHVQDKNKHQYDGGTLNLIHGTRQFLSQSKLTIRPEVGDFYLFPNYLMHTVYPFKNSEEERRSISFNAKIDEEIFDVYGQGK